MQRRGRHILKQLHADPNIYIVDDFLTDREILHLGELTDGLAFQRSYMDDDRGVKVVSQQRTSQFMFLRKQHDAVVRAIEGRAAALIGFPEDHVEPFQMVRYTKGQQFKTHHDMGPIVDDEKRVRVVPPRRVVTLFAYLNTTPKGQGCTEFPMLNIKVSPRRGRVLIFCNVDASGEPDMRVRHRAQPVGEGVVKYGLNIWVSAVTMQALACASSSRRRPRPKKTSPGRKKRVSKHLKGFHKTCVDDNTRCTVCGSAEREARMVLCDWCDRGFHMGCLNPPLRRVPRRDWFCPLCSVGSTGAGGVDVDVQSEEEGTRCEKCCRTDGADSMVLCDGCDKGFHTECLGMLCVPDGNWFCSDCVTAKRGSAQKRKRASGRRPRRKRKDRKR